MTRISTLAQHQLQLNFLRTNQVKFNNFGSQLYTGLKAQRYSEVASQSGRLLRLDELQTKSENYIKTIDLTETRLALMEANLDSLDKLANGYITVLEQTRDNVAAPTANLQAGEYLKTVAAQLNETDGERYLFGGSQLRSTAPVSDLTLTSANPLPSVPAVSPSIDFTRTAGTNFTVGQTITSSSGGTATVAAVTQVTSGGATTGRVYLQAVGGTFLATDTLTTATATADADTAMDYPVQDTRVVTYSGLAGGAFAGAGLGTSDTQIAVGTVLTSATGTAVVEQVTATSATAGKLIVRTTSGTFTAGQAITQGAATAKLASVDYYTNPAAAFDAPVGSKVADDLTVTYGVTANNPAFDKIIRVLNYFQNQTIPFDEDQVATALTQLRNAREDIRALRADAAFDRITLKDEKASHQIAINLQKNARDDIIRADEAEAGASLNATKTQLETSYAVLSTIKSLSLVNFLR